MPDAIDDTYSTGQDVALAGLGYNILEVGGVTSTDGHPCRVAPRREGGRKEL